MLAPEPMNYKQIGHTLNSLTMLYDVLKADLQHHQDYRTTTSFSLQSKQVAPNNPIGQLLHTLHITLRSAANRISMNFTKPGGAFRNQLAEITFEYPYLEATRNDVLNILEQKKDAITEYDSRQYAQLVSAFKELPASPTLEDIWDLFSTYRTAYQAISSRADSGLAMRMDKLDIDRMAHMVSAFMDQLLKLDEMRLEVVHPYKAETTIEVTLPTDEICYPLTVLALSGGKGMLGAHQPRSVATILKHNGTTTDIVDNWYGLQNAILNKLKETHPDIADEPYDLLRCNQFLPGNAQIAHIKREIEDALPSIVALRNGLLTESGSSISWGAWAEDKTITGLAELVGYNLSQSSSLSSAPYAGR